MQHNGTPGLKIGNIPEISKNIRHGSCLYKILTSAVWILWAWQITFNMLSSQNMWKYPWRRRHCVPLERWILAMGQSRRP